MEGETEEEVVEEEEEESATTGLTPCGGFQYCVCIKPGSLRSAVLGRREEDLSLSYFLALW